MPCMQHNRITSTGNELLVIAIAIGQCEEVYTCAETMWLCLPAVPYRRTAQLFTAMIMKEWNTILILCKIWWCHGTVMKKCRNSCLHSGKFRQRPILSLLSACLYFFLFLSYQAFRVVFLNACLVYKRMRYLTTMGSMYSDNSTTRFNFSACVQIISLIFGLWNKLNHQSNYSISMVFQLYCWCHVGNK